MNVKYLIIFFLVNCGLDTVDARLITTHKSMHNQNLVVEKNEKGTSTQISTNSQFIALSKTYSKLTATKDLVVSIIENHNKKINKCDYLKVVATDDKLVSAEKQLLKNHYRYPTNLKSMIQSACAYGSILGCRETYKLILRNLIYFKPNY